MLNYFVNFINTKLGLKDDLLEVMNESFSWSSGKGNLFKCMMLVSMPLIRHFIFSRNQDVFDVPYCAIRDHVIDGFGEKLVKWALFSALSSNLDTVVDFIDADLLLSVKRPIYKRFVNRQFPDTDNGAVNVHALGQNNGQANGSHKLENIYSEEAESFSKAYLRKTVATIRMSLGLVMCFYRVHQKANTLSHLMPAPLNSKFGLPIALLIVFASTSYLINYVSGEANKLCDELHEAMDKSSNLVRESSGQKSRSIISDNRSKSMNDRLMECLDSMESVDKRERVMITLNSIITGGAKIMEKLYIFATFGVAVINSNHESQHFYSMLDEVGYLGIRVHNLINLHSDRSKFYGKRDILQNCFEKLASATSEVAKQKALITQSPDIILAITNTSVEVPDKGLITIGDLVVNKGEVCALTGQLGKGKSTLFNAIQTGTGLKEGGKLVRVPDAELYMSSQSQDIDRTEGGTLMEKLRPKDSTITDATIMEQITFLGLTHMLDKLDKHVENLKLSGGEQKAYTLLRAINSGAKLVLLDEPTSGLDPENTTIFRNFIRAEADKGIAFLIIDHTNLDEDAQAKGLYNRVYNLTGDAVIAR